MLINIDGVKNILNSLKVNGYTAYVAGGWIRDIDNGIEPKDVDFFVVDDIDYMDVRDCLVADGYVRMDASRYHSNYGGMRDDVDGVIKCHGSGIDVVMMNSGSIEDTCLNFDVSICQIYCKLDDNGDLVVYVSKDYLDWVNDGIIYKYTNILTTENHLSRIKAKFNVDLIPKISDSIEMVEWRRL